MRIPDFKTTDRVAAEDGRGRTRIGSVTRVTATQVLVRFPGLREEVRYRRDSARRVGAGTWDVSSPLRLATAEDHEQIAWATLLGSLHAARRAESLSDRQIAALQTRVFITKYLDAAEAAEGEREGALTS